MDRRENESEAYSLLKRAQRLVDFGEIHAAIDTLRQAVTADPELGNAWYLLGSLLYETGKIEEARSSLETAARLNPRRAEIWSTLGRLEFSEERYRDAVRAFSEYVKLGGSEIDTLLTFAKAAFRLTDCDRVLSVTSKIIDVDEDQYEAWELRGICQARLKRYNAAVMSLNMALELNKDSVYAFNTVGDLCYEEENYERALEFYRSSLAAEWEQPRVLFRLATCLWIVGRWQAAIPLFEQYVEMAPEDPRGWNNLGVVLREKGEVKRAMECYREALRLDPEFQIAEMNLRTAKNKQVAL